MHSNRRAYARANFSDVCAACPRSELVDVVAIVETNYGLLRCGMFRTEKPTNFEKTIEQIVLDRRRRCATCYRRRRVAIPVIVDHRRRSPSQETGVFVEMEISTDDDEGVRR
jgi:hypothetical protein